MASTNVSDADDDRAVVRTALSAAGPLAFARRLNRLKRWRPALS